VDISTNIRETAKPYIYPQAEIKYSMFDDIFIPYVGIKGGLKQNTLRSLSQQNEFMLPNSRLLNESTVFDAYAGFKGVLSKRLSFNIGANYARVNNKALFVSDTVFSNLNKFSVIYDSMNIMTIEGSLSYQLNEKLKIDGIGRFFSYETTNQAYAWNLPQLQFKVRGNYVLNNKFIFNLDVTLETGRKALVFDSTIAGVISENNQFAAPLNTFADINLSTEYKFNKMITGFIQLNNIASQRYLRWYNYPLTGFQIMGGATFKF
jgi:outer membrane receptor protein involved in Fe transport